MAGCFFLMENSNFIKKQSDHYIQINGGINTLLDIYISHMLKVKFFLFLLAPLFTRKKNARG